MTKYLPHIIQCSFQGVCQDHQATLHSPIQPLHPECGCAKRHTQHQQRGGGAATRARHRRWRPQPTEQTAGCLTARSKLQSINARYVNPKHRCRDTVCVSPFVSTMNVHCFWQNALLSPLHGIMAYTIYTSALGMFRHNVSKLHEPKELLKLRHCLLQSYLA